MTLVFVTSNPHKFEEVQEIAARQGVEVTRSQIPYIEIQSDSLEEIVQVGAQQASALFRAPCFVEDAGLFVDALKGFPGPYSKYAFMTIGNQGLLKLLDGVPDRGAEFRSAVGYCAPGGKTSVFSGKVRGTITTSPRGLKGFGFDPIFSPEGENLTFGEMSTAEKNKFSHRARAVEEFIRWFKTGK
ncbi:MAG: XTP/dITP diphosphatase [Candidatus Hadarchaeota archaeon]